MQLQRNFPLFLIIGAFVMQTSWQPLLAKHKILSRIWHIVTHNPFTKRSTLGPNILMPAIFPDIQKGIFFDNFSVVQTGALYRSAQLSAHRLNDYIQNYGIKTIINLRGKHPEQRWWQKEQAVAKRNNVNLLNIPTSAKTMTSKKNICAILDAFDHAPRPILVHCQAGIDRTGEVAALWVLDQQKKSKTEARKQLSLWHGHIRHPKKDLLIKIWRGREWFYHEYDPQRYA